jgi:acyl-[acyl-carrier-protein]-phospholipid O-acyltransferase/long-chain-fatty-acid--[acyl-carrier-protein] ligase
MAIHGDAPLLSWQLKNCSCYPFADVPSPNVEPMSTDPHSRPFYSVIPLLFSQTIGAFNDNAMKAILPVMAAYQFGKSSMDTVNIQVSVLLILPFVIFAPLAGWVADRFSKKKVVSLTLLAQLFGLGLLAYGLASEYLLTSLIGFFMLSTQSAFLSPAKKGILKELIGSNRLAMAVGWTEMLAMVGILGGAFAGAVSFDILVAGNGGWNAALILVLVTMALALLSWLTFLPTPSTEAPKAQPFKIGVTWSHFGDLRDLLKDRTLRGAALGDAWFWSVGGFFYLVLVKLSGEVIEGDVGLGTLYGYWFLLLGLGIMAGSLFVAYLNRGKIELGLTVIGGLIMPISLLILFLSNPMGKLFDLGCLSLGFSGALFFVPLNGYLQDQAEEDQRGRVLAATNLFTQLSGIVFIGFHAYLSSYLGLGAKHELLVILVPSVLIGVITLRALPGGIPRIWRHVLGKSSGRG